MRELTTAAKAAKLIRTELKKTFPEAKFRVRSNNYAGGDSVYVNWTDGPTDEQVSDITAKYQYGHFGPAPSQVCFRAKGDKRRNLRSKENCFG